MASGVNNEKMATKNIESYQCGVSARIGENIVMDNGGEGRRIINGGVSGGAAASKISR